MTSSGDREQGGRTEAAGVLPDSIRHTAPSLKMADGVCGTKPLVFRLHEGAPELVRQVLLERGWEEFEGQQQDEGDWNLYWRASAFRSSDYENIMPWQRLNHHPKTVGITRKDWLARNLRRMRGTFGSVLYNFSPTAFHLPNDYVRFLEEFSKHRLANGGKGAYWICKPVDLSRGRGIFIFEDIKDLAYDCPVIVQRYISNPLLISGYKFDLRIYVCVKSFSPLTIYIYQEGLVRFATEKFNLGTLNNLYSHLTNTSINKFGPFYSTDKEHIGQGSKWTLSKFRCFLRNMGINKLVFWQKINNIITLTILTIAPSAPSSPNCVELFGFDILIDENLKPWLLEVNYSPALSLDCSADVTVKKGLLNDLIDLLNYKEIDGLRQRGYLRQKYRTPCYLGSQIPQAKTPVVFLLPKSLCEPCCREKCQSQSCVCCRGGPPAESRGTAQQSPHHSSENLNCALRLALGSSLKPATSYRRRKTRSLHSQRPKPLDRSKALNLESESEDGSCATTPDMLRERSKKKAGSSVKLPPIHGHKYKSTMYPWDDQVQNNTVPPCRVGDFILTFPFNEVTLKASQKKLNIKVAVQEVHKLTSQLLSSRVHKGK
ncbi:probable tubulin polyglutamylase TTLL2 isoform X1 [Alosa sapidissima]|uniref:probable tubulin polyglutamylase TTLL2 isoform X1 n=2 Tax=Alosa sapidissima TaxID=34773 RepID=UPI001C0878E7|nr:probable tubulin polyglutamylase TTLL2 isoform X1 [Alosa sapidissima]